LISGDFLNTSRTLLRLNPDGTEDTTFNPEASGTFFAVAVQTDGRILLSRSAPGTGEILRLNSDGSLDPTFRTSLVFAVSQIGFQPDGQVLIAGWFHTVNGFPIHGIARLNNDAVLPFLTATTKSGTGELGLSLRGRLGARFLIETSSDLVSWIPWITLTNTAGVIEFSDPGRAEVKQRFYRARPIE
jgi:uncharacterized delta-60 repeat protein